MKNYSNSFPCPACGFLIFSEPPGNYEICSICGWEDDHVQLQHPLMGGGANIESLKQLQDDTLRKIPISINEVDRYKRDKSWRPLLEKDLEVSENMPRTGIEYFTAAVESESGYYWKK